MWCMCVDVGDSSFPATPPNKGVLQRETHLLDLIHFATKSLSVKGDMYV